MIREKIILVVDDDPDHLCLVERYVSRHGFQCKSAESGVEAIKCLETENISAVVTDIMMPEMDGMELLKYTKKHHPDIDVIVMTGYNNQYSYIDVIQEGAADFIAKPFKKGEFSAKLDRVFRERRLLKELRDAKEKAEAGSKAKSDFINIISHELRIPMNGILGFTGLLSKADLPSEKMRFVEMVAQSANRLMKLINQILDFSKIGAGKNDIKPCHFHLSSVFEEFFVTVQSRVEEKGLVLDLETDESLSKTLLFGDRVVLTQILYNLIDNAIKFTDSGSIEIKVKKVRELSKDTIELQFSIKDSGCGIEPEKQITIFEPFTQAEDCMTRRHEGAGLGLAICAKLVNMMEGDIWVESELEKGSIFHFTTQMEVV